VAVKATAADGSVKTFAPIPCIDTPKEVLYHRHRNILSYVSRQMI
jgi:aconitate hydratase